jgi:peptide deformylase
MHIHHFGDPKLVKPNVPVEDVWQYKEYLADMYQCMKEHNGCGLAAPQVGINAQFFMYKHDRLCRTLYNPVIAESEGSVIDYEGCLSIPGFTFPVQRFEKVLVDFVGPRGEHDTIEAEGWHARILQHEIDHLNGTLICHKLNREHKRNFIRKWNKCS